MENLSALLACCGDRFDRDELGVDPEEDEEDEEEEEEEEFFARTACPDGVR